MSSGQSSWLPVIIEVADFVDDDMGLDARICAVEGPETSDEELDRTGRLTDADWLRDEVNEDPWLVGGYYQDLARDELPAPGFYRARAYAWAHTYVHFEGSIDGDSGYRVNDPKEWVFVGADESVLDAPYGSTDTEEVPS